MKQSISETVYNTYERYTGPPLTEEERQAYFGEISKMLSADTGSNVSPSNIQLTDSATISDSIILKKYDRDGKLMEERKG